ncbi:MAG TPA: glycosyl hydrolase family 79 C-terminal domain-containing protein [Verrucomicrobiae bacterium]|nr:glycosyl hydrolase family 79 C-terminal domain-containing protein [Verrucomicrobiae bacterium]
MTVSVTNSPSYAIPSDFLGLSFGTETAGQVFSATNTQLITLFRQIGIRNLRFMGDEITNHIKNQFTFAQAEGSLEVIYGVPLTNVSIAADVAGYIWSKYPAQLDYFEIGNEPDWTSSNNGKTEGPAITNFTSFMAAWTNNATAMEAVAPGAVFEGIDTGGNYDTGPPQSGSGKWQNDGTQWTTDFASVEKNSGIVQLISQHDYMADMLPGGLAITNAANLFSAMLSPGWDTLTNQALYNAIGPAILGDGLHYRFTEANEMTGGIEGASDSFAAALWALDFLHWWAAHGSSGVNFHNQGWIPTDTIFPDTQGNYEVHPKAYALKAFDVGGHGSVDPLGMANPDNVNLTAYAVGDETNLYVTIINRGYGTGARNASVTIALAGFAVGEIEAMDLIDANGYDATNGVTLGGGIITNNAAWQGQWEALGSVTNNQCTVAVPATSAAIIKIVAGPEFLGLKNISPGQIQLNWSYGFLQSATNVIGPFIDVPNASSPYTILMGNAQEYYRVREN